MKAVVFAYHNMGITGIRRVLDAGFDIPLVFSHEDDPGENLWFGSVRKTCHELNIPCICPRNPNQFGWIEQIKAAGPDFIFSFYYRNILKPSILRLARLGSYGLHGSYLPAYRGRCPENWVLINGETTTGVTLHEMVEKPNAGPIVIQKKVDISSEDTVLTLFHKLQEASDAMLAEILPAMASGAIRKSPMNLLQGSYFSPIKPEDGRLFWDRSAGEIYNLIRAVTRPFSGAFCFVGDEMVTFWQAVPHDDTGIEPGRLVFKEGAVLIGTGRGCIRPLEIEVYGRTLMGTDLLSYFRSHEKDLLE